MSEADPGNQAAESANRNRQQPTAGADCHARGVEHCDCGVYVRAVEFLSHAVALRPSVPAFHADLAEAYRNLGDGSRAAGCCRIALKL